jgi:hypothetical protein
MRGPAEYATTHSTNAAASRKVFIVAPGVGGAGFG